MCLECKASFSRKRRPHFSLFLNFYRFIRGNHNKNGLSETTGFSRTTIWRKFSPFFSYFVSAVKINEILTKNCGSSGFKPWVLGLDGKWLRRLGIIIIYRNITDKINLFWSFHSSESYDSLKKDFETLSPLIKDNLPIGVISDWKGSIRASVSAFLGDIPHQRCLSHIQREAARLLPLKSPYLATRELRKIALEMILISDPSDLYKWVLQLNVWIEKYQSFLKEKTIGINTKKKWWYTHGNLRRAYRLLSQNHEHSFCYLKYPFLPTTNNSLEGINSQIKSKLGTHRGMKINQQVSFAFWWLAFSRIKNTQDVRKLWALLKNEIFAG